MNFHARKGFLRGLAWIGAMPLALAATPDIGRLRSSLEKFGWLDGESVERLQAGQVVARVLDTHRDSEVACLGAVIIAVPSEYYLNQFRDIGRFKKGPEIPQVARLSNPSSVSDVRNLSLTRADADALKTCRPGNCNLKLSTAMMGQIAKGLDGSPNTLARADLVFRAVLIDYVKRYLAEGNRGLACYADESPPVCLSKELSELSGEFSLLRQYAPALYEQLSQIPAAGPDSFLYWSLEDLGPLKPVLNVTHVIIYSEEFEGLRWSFVVSKQIYASHYFRASLGLTVLVDVGHGSVLMLYLNRSRVDGLGGWLGAVKRALVRHKLRSGIEQNVARVRASLERSYRSSQWPR